MDKVICVFGCYFLAVIRLSVYGAETPLEVKLVNMADWIQVRTGDSFIVNCSLNRGLAIILDYKIQFVHRSVLDPQNPFETELTEQQGLLPSAPPDIYSITFSYNHSTTFAALTVKNVVDDMDGQYICRAKSIKNANSVLRAAMDVIVFSDVQAVEMTVGSGKVDHVSEVPIVLDHGIYPVACSARGFNGDADIIVTLDGKTLETTPAEPVLDPQAAAAAGARRYSLKVTTAANITFQSSNKKIQCTATARGTSAVPTTASAPLNIKWSTPSAGSASPSSFSPTLVIALIATLTLLL